MEIKILNNSISPSFLIQSRDKNILVNTPKGFSYSLKEKIDGVIFTSDDLYHTYDIEQLNYIKRKQIINCYIFREFTSNIEKKIKEEDLFLNIIEIAPYKSFEGITPLYLHKSKVGISSDVTTGLKIDKTLILPLFKSMTTTSKLFLNDLDLLLLTLKHLHKQKNNVSISVEEIVALISDNKIEEIGFLGLDKELKHTFDKKYLKVNNIIKTY